MINCLSLFVSKPCFLDSSTQNHAETLWNQLPQKVSFGPEACEISWKVGISTCPWAPKAQSKGETLEKNMWNTFRKKRIDIYIYIYIYMECIRDIYLYIRNIHKYLWYKIIRNTGAAFEAEAPLGLLSLFLILYIIHKYLLTFFIYSLYIPYIYICIYISEIFSIYVPLGVS